MGMFPVLVSDWERNGVDMTVSDRTTWEWNGMKIKMVDRKVVLSDSSTHSHVSTLLFPCSSFL